MSTRPGGHEGLEVKIMEKMTIPQKRASVYREWILSKLGNDERYYMSTLYTGIPDGDDLETALADLADGLYDDDLDDMIDLYRSAKKAYGKSGYYVKKQLIFNEDEALSAAGYSIPDRIYMKH